MRWIRFLFMVMLVLPAGCAPGMRPGVDADSSRPWRYADLRLVDGLDDAPAERDIVAAYARESGADIEIRVDLLQSKSVFDYDLYLAVDSRPGGQDALPTGGQGALGWEVWVKFPAYGGASAVTAGGAPAEGLSARLYRDLDLDAAVIRLGRAELGSAPERMNFQIFLTEPNQSAVVEHSETFRFDGSPPPRARLLLAFWNCLPAQTPAQALRRWDGAHTGPAGHRHGLYQILKAVESTRVPVALLDLKTADSLAGLEQVGGLDLARRLAAQGLLLLPDTAAGDPQAAVAALGLSRAAAARFGLPASPFAYGALRAPLPARYRAVFSGGTGLAEIVQSGALRAIPLPGLPFAATPSSGETEVSADGLSLSARKRLVEAASGGAGWVVLGGDVQNTLWAGAETAAPALRYVANHPWIQALDGNDLLTMPARRVDELPVGDGCADMLCAPPVSEQDEALRESLRQGLDALPEGEWREAAWSMYLRLTQPTADARRAALQAGYLGQVGYLLAAGDWLERPVEQSACGQDVDSDGQGECVLSTRELFTVLEPDGARLALAVHRGEDGAQEWIAPAAQFGLGLGAPEEWQIGQGEASDPRLVPGGLADLPDAFVRFQPSSRAGEISFHGPEGQEKIYRLSGSRIEVEYRGYAEANTRLPLVLGAGRPREPGWGRRFYIQQTENPGSYGWRTADQTGVTVRANAAIQARSPLDSFGWMRFAEDPDREYPPGHFVPYPLAELSIHANGPLTVTIEKN